MKIVSVEPPTHHHQRGKHHLTILHLAVTNPSWAVDKTEFLIIGTPGQLKKVNFKEIHICEADVSSTEEVHNLGFIFDIEMNCKAQINNISKE